MEEEGDIKIVLLTRLTLIIFPIDDPIEEANIQRMTISKDTERKKKEIRIKPEMLLYEVTVSLKDHIIGFNETDAINKYKEWLDQHTNDWTITSIRKIGKAW